jgi:hypothetical protein
MKQQNRILFHEVQRMREGSIWWLFVVMSLFTLGLVLWLAVRGEIPKQEVLIVFVLVVPTFMAAFYLMYVAKLETTIKEEGVYYRWAPFFRKPFLIRRETIARTEERKSPLWQYGFNLFPGYGKLHTVKGRQGIQFYLTNGRRIYIGTQELFRFRKALETITAKHKY